MKKLNKLIGVLSLASLLTFGCEESKQSESELSIEYRDYDYDFEFNENAYLFWETDSTFRVDDIGEIWNRDTRDIPNIGTVLKLYWTENDLDDNLPFLTDSGKVGRLIDDYNWLLGIVPQDTLFAGQKRTHYTRGTPFFGGDHTMLYYTFRMKIPDHKLNKEVKGKIEISK